MSEFIMPELPENGSVKVEAGERLTELHERDRALKGIEDMHYGERMRNEPLMKPINYDRLKAMPENQLAQMDKLWIYHLADYYDAVEDKMKRKLGNEGGWESQASGSMHRADSVDDLALAGESTSWNFVASVFSREDWLENRASLSRALELDDDGEVIVGIMEIKEQINQRTDAVLDQICAELVPYMPEKMAQADLREYLIACGSGAAGIVAAKELLLGRWELSVTTKENGSGVMKDLPGGSRGTLSLQDWGAIQQLEGADKFNALSELAFSQYGFEEVANLLVGGKWTDEQKCEILEEKIMANVGMLVFDPREAEHNQAISDEEWLAFYMSAIRDHGCRFVSATVGVKTGRRYDQLTEKLAAVVAEHNTENEGDQIALVLDVVQEFGRVESGQVFSEWLVMDGVAGVVHSGTKAALGGLPHAGYLWLSEQGKQMMDGRLENADAEEIQEVIDKYQIVGRELKAGRGADRQIVNGDHNVMTGVRHLESARAVRGLLQAQQEGYGLYGEAMENFSAEYKRAFREAGMVVIEDSGADQDRQYPSIISLEAPSDLSAEAVNRLLTDLAHMQPAVTFGGLLQEKGHKRPILRFGLNWMMLKEYQQGRLDVQSVLQNLTDQVRGALIRVTEFNNEFLAAVMQPDRYALHFDQQFPVAAD